MTSHGKFTFLIAAAVAFGVSGCTYSIHPIYTNDDLIFDASLVGTWRDAEFERGDVWQFERAGDKAYRWVWIGADGERNTCSAHLAKINGHTFLDLQVEALKVDGQDVSNDAFSGVLRLHQIFLVEQRDATFQLRGFSDGWLKEYLRENPTAIAHTLVDDGKLILTASTEELQEFAVKHIETPGAYANPLRLTRK